MHPERWQTLKEVFHTALLQDKEERSTYLNRVCAADPSLKQEIEEMLASDAEAGSFIEKPVLEAASDLLATPTDEALSVGREIGPYRIVSKLGAGGMGEVYLAQHTLLGRCAALKVLAPALVGDPNSRARFLREARLASALDHANVCTIYEIGSADGRDFISMQYVEGDTLKHVVAGQPLGLPRLRSIALQVADALEVAHAHEIVHRDINSNNIMVTAQGQVKVLDFGLAKVERLQGNVAADSTLSRATFGTPAFMSPEQARGERADHRSDIFSVGVVLYEMATGRLPFKRASAAETMNAVINEPHRPPGEVNAQITPALAAVIDRALSKDPAERYQSAREMHRDLQQLTAIEDGAVRRKSRLSWVHRLRTIERLGRHKTAVFAVVVAVVAATGAGTLLFERDPEIDSIAVLPFTNERTGPDADYLSEGLTESVINTLAQLPRLRVMARSTMFTYRERNIDPRTVGQELRVVAVLTGHIVQRGDQLIIGMEMVDVANGSRLWGESYTRSLAELPALPADLAKDVSRQVGLHLGHQEQHRLTAQSAGNTEAYQLYLKGRYFFNRRTADGFKKGIEYFRQAIEKDSTYAVAYAGLADCYTQLGAYQILSPRDSYPQARAAAEKALHLDDRLAEAHTSLALVHMHAGEWSFAEERFQRAIELNPNYESAHRWYGFHLAGVGRMDEAIAATKRAQDLDPLSIPTNTQLGRMLYLSRQYDQAVEQLRKTLEMDPSFARAHLLLGWALVQKKMYSEAIAEYEKAIALGGRTTYIAEIGRVHALSGKRREAEQVLDELKTLAKHTFVPAYDMAQIYEALGEQEQAIAWLEKALDDGPSQFMLKVDPKWDSLRAHPRFRQLLHRLPH